MSLSRYSRFTVNLLLPVRTAYNDSLGLLRHRLQGSLVVAKLYHDVVLCNRLSACRAIDSVCAHEYETIHFTNFTFPQSDLVISHLRN